MKRLAIEVMTLGLERGNDYAINVGKFTLGSYLVRSGEFEKGIKYLIAADKYFEKVENYIVETQVLNEIGNGYQLWGRLLDAEKYYLKSLKAGKKTDDPGWHIMAEVNLGKAYINMGKYDKASALLQHFKNQALKMKKYEAVANAYAYLGLNENFKNNLALSTEYYQKSADYGFRSKDKSMIANAYTNLAIVHFENENMEKSLECFKKALDLRLETNDPRQISEAYFNLGGYFIELGKHDLALDYYRECMEWSQKNNLLKEQMEVTFAIAEVYKLENNFKKALDITEQYASLQERYYKKMAFDRSEDAGKLSFLDNLETVRKAESQEESLRQIIDNNRYKNIVIYFVLSVFIIAMLVLLFYRKKIN